MKNDAKTTTQATKTRTKVNGKKQFRIFLDEWMCELCQDPSSTFIYAMIFSYYRNGQKYFAAQDYLANNVLHQSVNNVNRLLNKLVEKKLLIKTLHKTEGFIKLYDYTINEQFVPGWVLEEVHKTKSKLKNSNTVAVNGDTSGLPSGAKPKRFVY